MIRMICTYVHDVLVYKNNNNNSTNVRERRNRGYIISHGFLEQDQGISGQQTRVYLINAQHALY